MTEVFNACILLISETTSKVWIGNFIWDSLFSIERRIGKEGDAKIKGILSSSLSEIASFFAKDEW